MKTESKTLENGDLQITLTFDSHDQLCLKHDLLDIESWYMAGPSSQKIKACEHRMIKENRDKLMSCPEMANKTMNEVTALLDDPVACCQAISKLEGYKNRQQREAENVDYIEPLIP